MFDIFANSPISEKQPALTDSYGPSTASRSQHVQPVTTRSIKGNMIVSSCPNWHISHAEKGRVATLGEPDALKGARPVRRGGVGVPGQPGPGLLPYRIVVPRTKLKDKHIVAKASGQENALFR